jgi:hypothetical protein
MIPLCAPVQGDDFDYPNRYQSMAESMVDMMDAMGSAYNKRRYGTDSPSDSRSSRMPSSPWGGGMPGSGFGASPWGGMPGSGFSPSPWGGMPGSGFSTSPWSGMPGSSFPAPPWGEKSPSRPKSSFLDGSWQGNSGEILIIRDGRFRIYLDRDNYRDGQLRMEGQHLSMYDPASRTTRQYEYAQQDGRLALRDELGNLLLYRRINSR